MSIPYACDCERGGDCTRTTMCAVQSALEDQAGEYERRIDELVKRVKALRRYGYGKTGERIEIVNGEIIKHERRVQTFGVRAVHLGKYVKADDVLAALEQS